MSERHPDTTEAAKQGDPTLTVGGTMAGRLRNLAKKKRTLVLSPAYNIHAASISDMVLFTVILEFDRGEYISQFHA